jgi:hypothetical protein
MVPGGRRLGVVLVVGLVLVAVSPARGAVWMVQPTPFAGSLGRVSCVSAKFCVALGGGEQLAGIGVLRWDGRGWRLQATPDPDPAHEALRDQDSLGDVSCISSKACVAVGEFVPSVYSPDGMHVFDLFMPLAERWNGVSWSLLPFPSLPSGGQSAVLSAVSCTSGSACMAVGGFERSGDALGGLFAERWYGSSWSIESMPDPVEASFQPTATPFITGLSCWSSSFCTAVGYSYVATGVQAFAERWDGRSWSLESTPQVAGAFMTEPADVSCTSPSACVAVGDYSTAPSLPLRTLAERWNGASWSVQRTPNVPGDSNHLAGVSCTSSRACMAVGDAHSNRGFQLLVERWDGTSWSLEQTPSASGALLQGVSCTSSVICTAVGYAARGNVVVEQSGPATAKLSRVPVPCASARFTMHVTGTGISSVAWSLDSKRIRGRSIDRGTRYVASVRVSPGRHKLIVKVKFTASSQTHAHTFRRNVLGCSLAD